MKFLADAQLPAGLSALLNRAGHDCVHTSDLPQGNTIPDEDICTLADDEGRIVITNSGANPFFGCVFFQDAMVEEIQEISSELIEGNTP